MSKMSKVQTRHQAQRALMGYYSGQGRTYYGSIAIATLCWLARLSCRIIHVQPWMPAILLHPPLHK